MSETSSPPLITPTLLRQRREEALQQKHQTLAEMFIASLPNVLNYEQVLESLSSGKQEFDLRFVWRPEYDLERFKTLCRAGLQAHLNTLVDPQCYEWNLMPVGGSLYLRLDDVTNWWQCRLRELQQPTLVTQIAEALLPRLCDSRFASEEDTRLSLGPDALVIVGDQFRCIIHHNASLEVCFEDEKSLLLKSQNLPGNPVYMAMTATAVISARLKK